MKKFILILLSTVLLITFCVCNTFSNVVIGEIPKNGLKINLNDVSMDSYDNKTKKDAFHLRVNSEKFEYSKEWVSYNTYDFETGEYIDLKGNNQFFLHDSKLELKANNLKDSKYINDLNIYASLKTYNKDNEFMNSEFLMLNENEKALLSLNDVMVNLINQMGLKVTNKIAVDKSLFKIEINNDTPKEVTQNILNAFINNFVDLYFYRLHIYAIVNITHDNLFTKVNNFLNDLYNNKVLEYYGYEYNIEEYNKYSLDIIEDLKITFKEFKYIKSTIIIGLSGIKKIFLDLDLSIIREDKYINNDNEEIYLYSEKTSIKTKCEIDIKNKHIVLLPSGLE